MELSRGWTWAVPVSCFGYIGFSGKGWGDGGWDEAVRLLIG